MPAATAARGSGTFQRVRRGRQIAAVFWCADAGGLQYSTQRRALCTAAGRQRAAVGARPRDRSEEFYGAHVAPIGGASECFQQRAIDSCCYAPHVRVGRLKPLVGFAALPETECLALDTRYNGLALCAYLRRAGARAPRPVAASAGAARLRGGAGVRPLDSCAHIIGQGDPL